MLQSPRSSTETQHCINYTSIKQNKYLGHYKTLKYICIYQITLYTLSLHNVIGQLYLNKVGKIAKEKDENSFWFVEV